MSGQARTTSQARFGKRPVANAQTAPTPARQRPGTSHFLMFTKEPPFLPPPRGRSVAFTR